MGSTRLICLSVAAALAVMASSSAARADTVTDWNGFASTAIVATAGQSPHAASLSFAMVQGAVYDAVNAIDRGHRPYLAAPPARRGDSKDAAAATAAFRVLVGLFPAQRATLQSLYDGTLGALPAGPSKTGGVAVGDQAAAAMLTARANDGRNGPSIFAPGTAPGIWRPTPPTFATDPASWVAVVTPFVIPTAAMFRTAGSNRLTSSAYAKDFDEVKAVGSLTSITRTADQTMAAIFWQDNGLALWNRVFRSLSAGRGLDIVTNARLFAMENLGAADAAIACWADKYARNSWRPITAIREAETDGNPATKADLAWTPLFDPAAPTAAPALPPLVTPGFPEHPSGHTCISGAIVHGLRRFFATDNIPLSITSARFPGQTRTFARLSDVLDEIIDARVWGGIHFRTADVQGAKLGRKVDHWLRHHAFQRSDGVDGAGDEGLDPAGEIDE
jgi:hypothetical protein